MPISSITGKGGTGHLSRNDGKTYCLDTENTNAVEIVAMRGRPNDEGINEQHLEKNNTGKTNALASVQKDNLVIQLNPSKESGGKQPFQQNRIYDVDGISPALLAQMSCGTHAISDEKRIRRLTPTECCRLQNVPDDYFLKDGKEVVSDTQIYRQLGNGWTIDIIAYIFSYIK